MSGWLCGKWSLPGLDWTAKSDAPSPGEEWLFTGARLMKTRHGYSFITPQSYPGSGGLIVTGLLATRPYPVRPVEAVRGNRNGVGGRRTPMPASSTMR